MGMQFPLTGILCAVLFGMACQDMAFDKGTSSKKVNSYYAVTHGAEFPYNDFLKENTWYPHKLDVFGGACVVVSIVAVVMSFFHKNLQEFQVPLLLAGVMYLRDQKVRDSLRAMVASTKAGQEPAGEIAYWNQFVFVGLFCVLWITISGLHIRGKGMGGFSTFRFSIPAFGLAMLAGVLVQDLIFDRLYVHKSDNNKTWVYHAKYYKDVTGSTIALTKNINQTIDFFGPLGHKAADVTGFSAVVGAYETELGATIKLTIWIDVVVGIIAASVFWAAIRALKNLDFRAVFMQLVGVAAMAPMGWIYFTQLEPIFPKLKEIADLNKGKEEAAKLVKREQTEAVLDQITHWHTMLVGCFAFAISVQILINHSGTSPKDAEEPEEENDTDDEEDDKKTQ